MRSPIMTQNDFSLASGLRRPAALIFLHWLTLALIALAVGIIFAREGIDEKASRALLMGLHKSLGLTVLLVTLIRLGLRVLKRPLPPVAPVSPMANLAATVVHLGLYALLFALPLLGWALSSANGKPVMWFGLITLPPLVQQDEDAGDLFGELHEGAAELLFVLVAVHAAAALFHHYFLRDRTLRAMLPAFLDR